MGHPAALAIASCSTLPASNPSITLAGGAAGGSHGVLKKGSLAISLLHVKERELRACVNLGHSLARNKYISIRAQAGSPQRPMKVSHSVVAAVAEKASEYNVSSGGGSPSQSQGGGEMGSDSEEFAGYKPWGGNNHDTAGAVLSVARELKTLQKKAMDTPITEEFMPDFELDRDAVQDHLELELQSTTDFETYPMSSAWIGVGVACGACRPVSRECVTKRSFRRTPAIYAMGGRWKRDGRRSLCGGALRVQSGDIDITLDGNAYEETETEDEARTRNWKERGWAPWEELRTPEAQFALDSLADGEEEPAISWEDFQKLNRKQYQKKMDKDLEDAAKKEEEERTKSLKFEGSLWEKPLVFTLTPPQDWPPPGWKVDAKELAFIRKRPTSNMRTVTLQDLDESNLQPDGERFDVPRWEMFLKQYEEWVAANKDKLEQDAVEVDGEYYAGRRRTGEEYREGMYELPFVYPGQHYWGVVSYVSLYEGAFVYFGGVHDGWVPIMDNDWYAIRKHIKVGMRVHIEVMAKRDPYRFRFPIEVRFVDPNIDHLIFKRFKYPPIFGRKEDINLDEVARESNRPFFPKLRPDILPEEEEVEAAVHPYIRRLWMVHEAEQMILEDEDTVDDNDWEEWATAEEEEDDPTGEWSDEPGILHEIDDLEVPTIVLHVDEKHLDLEAARLERQVFQELRAKANGDEFEQPEGRFEERVKELNDAHQQRWSEEREALVRDKTCRLELGLPMEEPGRYADKSFWGKNPYDPREPQWRHDYWGDPNNFKEELRKDRGPRSRREAGGEVDDLLDDLSEDVTMKKDEGADQVKEGGFTYDDAVAKLIFGESDDRGAVNGRAASSLAKDDWNLLDKRDVESLEGQEEANDDPIRDDD